MRRQKLGVEWVMFIVVNESDETIRAMTAHESSGIDHIVC